MKLNVFMLVIVIVFDLDLCHEYDELWGDDHNYI